MPLPAAAPRTPIHHRRVDCRGYRRADGLWDIEGHLTDVKAYGFDNDFRGHVAAGEPVHEMWLRLTLDDDMVVHDVAASTDASPYRICPEITGNFARLKGLRIGPGFRQRAVSLVGGIQGCTHIVEMLGPLATAAIQTMMPILSRERGPGNPDAPPRMLDTCHALRSDGEVAKKQWPKFYTGV